MLKRFPMRALILLLLLLCPQLYAEDASAPVQRIMDMAVKNWSQEEFIDYFDAPEPNFSTSFITTYQAATRYPATEGGTDPFGYDVLTSSQDGCPLRNIEIAPPVQEDDKTIVNVSFNGWDCETADPEARNQLTRLKFDIVSENGAPRITDIHRWKKDTQEWDSLVTEMKRIIENGGAL